MSTYYNLGTHTRPITTVSADAQRWFDRGLNWLYGFNHVEASACFEQAISADSACAMAYWGMAYAHGPYINKEWWYYAEQERVESLALCYEMAQRAIGCCHGATSAEQALIHALNARFPSPTVVDNDTFCQWNADYVVALRDVYQQFPDDIDVATLFVEAMMMETPWKLWNMQTGDPDPAAHTAEMMAVLDAAFAQIDAQALPPHPGLLHMHIHTLEMSPFPERALRSADALSGLTPDNGHLLHMPGHIYELCGEYAKAIQISHQAVAADTAYLAQIGPFTDYTAAYCHDQHLLMLAANLAGQYLPAKAAAGGIERVLTAEVLDWPQGQLRRTLESYRSMSMHVPMRFGKWQDILDTPLPSDADLYPITTAMAHYARAIAAVTLGRFTLADQERTLFQATVDRLPADYYFLNNYARDTLAVAAAMMDGEIAYHRGDHATAYAHLRTAVTRNDNLNYTEPWTWMHPPRHALGALLLAQGHVAEAEAVYRADLGFDPTVNRSTCHPNNVWSLHGYAECLQVLGKSAELALIQPALTLALARTDVPITSSCFCRASADDCGCCAGSM